MTRSVWTEPRPAEKACFGEHDEIRGVEVDELRVVCHARCGGRLAAGNYFPDADDLEQKLRHLTWSLAARDTKAMLHALLDSALPRMEKDLRDWLQRIQSVPHSTPAQTNSAIDNAILFGGERFMHVPVPALAIFAVPHAIPTRAGVDSATLARERAEDSISTTQQVNAFAAGIPSARIVRLPHANHFVFQSNEADVFREMNAFLATVSP